MTTSAEDRAAIAEADAVRHRVAWAHAAHERAVRAAGRLLWAQGFSRDAKRRAAEAGRSAEARRPLRPPR